MRFGVVFVRALQAPLTRRLQVADIWYDMCHVNGCSTAFVSARQSPSARSREIANPSAVCRKGQPVWCLMKALISVLVVPSAALAGTTASAQNASPAGLWKNINDTNGKSRAQVREM